MTRAGVDPLAALHRQSELHHQVLRLYKPARRRPNPSEPSHVCGDLTILQGLTWSGSAFSQQAFLPEAALSVTGPVVIYEMTYPSGRVSTQRMCGVCHTRIYNSNSARPGFVIVRAGTLDRSDELEVVAHIWVKRKQPWLPLPAGVPAWPEGAPPAELLQALRLET